MPHVLPNPADRFVNELVGATDVANEAIGNHEHADIHAQHFHPASDKPRLVGHWGAEGHCGPNGKRAAFSPLLIASSFCLYLFGGDDAAFAFFNRLSTIGWR